MTGEWRWWLVAVAVGGLAAAAIPMALHWSELPEPIAIHWSTDWRPDGAAPKRFALLLDSALIAGALLLSLIGASTAYARGRATRLMLVTLVSGTAATTSTTIVLRNLHKASWTDADALSGTLLLAQLAVSIAAAALAYFLGLRAWRDARPAEAVSEAALPLAAGARAFWSGGASNRWLLAIGAALLAQAVVLQALLPRLRLLPVWLALHFVVLVVLELFSTIRVTIDGRGVAIRYGHLGVWTRRIPLSSIVAAQVLALDALEHGGWGYRGSLRLFGKAAIVVRSGTALRLELSGRRQLFVTVDDAATAARLLNALIERGPGPAAAPALSAGHGAAGA